MLNPFTLSLGGIIISLIPDQIAGEYEAVNRVVDFQTNALPEIVLKIHALGFPQTSDRTVEFETIQGWQLFHLEGKRIIKVRSRQLDPYLVGEFSTDFRSGDFYLAKLNDALQQYRFPLSYPMGELYFMNLLGTGLGMMFHAAGVIYQGKGYLFAGKSGAGKTTTCQLWQLYPEAKVVNDDKVIIRQQPNEFRLYGTPWHGEGGMALPDSAPLARIFLLKHGSQNSLTPLSPVQAASELLGRSFIPLWDASKIDFTLKFLSDLLENIPCDVLNFLPDISAVKFVVNLD